MKTTLHALRGLASSLLLNAGLLSAAQHLDHASRSGNCAPISGAGGVSFTIPCNLPQLPARRA